MLLDNNAQPAISQAMLKKAHVLQVGQGIFAEAAAKMIADNRVIGERMLSEAAANAILAAAIYVQIAEQSSAVVPTGAK